MSEPLNSIEMAYAAAIGPHANQIEGKAMIAEHLHAALTALRAPAAPELGGLGEIQVERERQRTVEGWTPEHDDTHNQGEMALAAAHYAIVSVAQALPAPSPEHPSQKFWLHQHADAVWPWDIVWRKPKDRRRNLVRAGALIVAEIERLDRAALAQHQGAGQTSGGA